MHAVLHPSSLAENAKLATNDTTKLQAELVNGFPYAIKTMVYLTLGVSPNERMRECVALTHPQAITHGCATVAVWWRECPTISDLISFLSQELVHTWF